jgi:FO synthase
MQVLDRHPLAALMSVAEALTLAAHGERITYSRKVFIPLTQLCRDVCHYCTFATPPRRTSSPFLSPDEVLAIAHAGEKMGCREALFTLGDRPEARYAVARDALAQLGHETTLGYLGEVSRLVTENTSLLPHLNPGLLSSDDYAALRPYAASMGLMLESTSDRL